MISSAGCVIPRNLPNSARRRLGQAPHLQAGRRCFDMVKRRGDQLTNVNFTLNGSHTELHVMDTDKVHKWVSTELIVAASQQGYLRHAQRRS